MRNTELVVVETISIFKHRYIIRVPEDKREWALDAVTMEEVDEFDQEHLDELITSHYGIDENELYDLFMEYGCTWKDGIDRLVYDMTDLNEDVYE